MAASRRPPARGSAPSRGSRGASSQAPRRPTSTRAPVGRPTGTRFTARALILLAVVVLLVASYTATLHAWWQQRSEISALEQANRQAEQDIDELHDEIDRWDDPAFIKQQARDRFGWVMPGEVGYRVIGVDGQLQGEVGRLDDPPSQADRAWYGKLWGSVEQAGEPPTSPEEQNPDEVLENP
ncbi:septum formation initiator family protein [Aeromicrobium phragmitis]|uniref:Septum formation initiator family protein n=1 Tax=Aeromicrobium phragmitis TaxID=2478914 RepID=A0A3L8PML0_9ACTN|nr:septum formation initiator family protein [Aeromicrobium phragmitis]RLV56585.1 septum formation initiator family protein [Aeromicrobium phragmitis]